MTEYLPHNILYDNNHEMNNNPNGSSGSAYDAIATNYELKPGRDPKDLLLT